MVESWREVTARGRGWRTSACAVERRAGNADRARRGCIVLYALVLLAVIGLIGVRRWLEMGE